MREALEHIIEARKDNKARKGDYEADIRAGRKPAGRLTGIRTLHQGCDTGLTP